VKTEKPCPVSKDCLPGVPKNRRAGGDIITLVLIRVDCPMGHGKRKDWDPSEDLFHYGRHIREGILIGECGKAVTQNGVELGLRTLLGLWMQGHC